MEHSNMAHDLSLAQSHAFHLCNDLMVPITLFKSGDEFGVYLNSQVVSPTTHTPLLKVSPTQLDHS